ALISIAGIDPQLPVFLTPALVGNVVDVREERGGAAAGVTECYSVWPALGRVHHVEHRAALRPGKTRDGLARAVSIIDDQADGCALRLCPIARCGDQHDGYQQSCGRAAGEATAPGHDRSPHTIRASLARLSRRPLLDNADERVESIG